MIHIRLLAVSYVRTILKQNKSQVSRRPACRKLQKIPYKMQLDTLPLLQKTVSVILNPAVRKSN